MVKLPTKVTRENVKDFLKTFDTLLTDCDGVIWTGPNVIGKANEAINKLQDLGKKVFLLTNNSTKSRDDYEKKCKSLGFNATKEQIVSSSSVTASYLKQQNFNKKVYIVGSSGISKELDAVNIRNFGVGLDPMAEGDPFAFVSAVSLDQEVGAVVVGFDPHFSLPKLMKAASYCNGIPGCLFLATNTDENFPIIGKQLTYPGTGCFVRAVETAVGRKALVMGKPESRMFDVIKDEHKLEPSRTIMVGDRCNTDILLGKNCSLSTMMVLTGCHSLDDVTQWAQSSDPEQQRLVPDYYIPSFGELIDLLE